MTLTTHAAAGMLVAQWTNDPLAGFFVALLSHYILDAIPHGDEFIYWRHVHNPKDLFAILVASTDLLCVILLLLTVLNYKAGINVPAIVNGAIGGLLPDLLVNTYTRKYLQFQSKYVGKPQQFVKLYHGILKIHYDFHMLFHNIMQTPIRFRTALAYQAVLVAAYLLYFVR